MNSFSENVKGLLREKRLSQAELATMSGVTEPSLCRYLSGKTTPRIDIVQNIARALGVSETYLLGTAEARTIDEREELKRMVARNRHILTKNDKNEIINLLYGSNDDDGK